VGHLEEVQVVLTEGDLVGGLVGDLVVLLEGSWVVNLAVQMEASCLEGVQMEVD